MGIEWAGNETRRKSPAIIHEALPAVEVTPVAEQAPVSIDIPESVIPKPDIPVLHIDTTLLPRRDSTNPNERFHYEIERRRRLNNND